MRVVDNLRHINERINEACNRSGRSSDEVTVIAVTKYVSPERAQEAVDAGITCLGENRDLELLRKQELMKGNPEMAFYRQSAIKKSKICRQFGFLYPFPRPALISERN